jgi:hypothetical protein
MFVDALKRKRSACATFAVTPTRTPSCHYLPAFLTDLEPRYTFRLFSARLDDPGINGLDLVRNIKKMYERGDHHVHILAASITRPSASPSPRGRNVLHPGRRGDLLCRRSNDQGHAGNDGLFATRCCAFVRDRIRSDASARTGCARRSGGMVQGIQRSSTSPDVTACDGSSL